MDGNPGSVENNALLININSPPGHNKVAKIHGWEGWREGVPGNRRPPGTMQGPF